MARARLQDDQLQGLEPEDQGYGGGGSVPEAFPGVGDGIRGPRPSPDGDVSGPIGSGQDPREIPGPGRDIPGTPSPAPDVRKRAPASTQPGGAVGGDASYTPVGPKSPAPVAAQPPQPFSPMAPLMDPGAMSVAMRAPFTPSPTAQYGGGGDGAGGLLGSQEGLLGGGLGVGGGDSFEDLSGEDPLDALIRILLSGGGGQ